MIGVLTLLYHCSKHQKKISYTQSLQVTELSSLRFGFLVSRRFEDIQPFELLNTFPWPQMQCQNFANYETILDAYFRSIGVNPNIIYRPYSFISKISAVEQGKFLKMVPQFAYKLVNPAKLKYFDAPVQPVFMKEYLYSLKSNQHIEKITSYIHSDREGN